MPSVEENRGPHMKKPTIGPFSLGAWALALAVTFSACRSVPTPEEAALQLLQGSWQGDGPGGSASLTISGNSLRFWARPDFWFETTLTIPAGPDLPQFHAAIIKESGLEQANVGKVVVSLYKIEGEKLTLGVVDDYAEPPTGTVPGNWDRVTDSFYFKRAQAPAPP